MTINNLILLFVSNGQVVAPSTSSVSIWQVHISAAEPHLLAAGLRLVRHLTLHVGGVAAVSHHILVVKDNTHPKLSIYSRVAIIWIGVVGEGVSGLNIDGMRAVSVSRTTEV